MIEAGEAGARWGLCLAPGFNAAATAQEGIVAWFTAVADRSPIPILVYHYPGVSNGLDVSPATLVALSKHANIVGCKLSHGDLSHLAQVALDPAVDRARFRVFTGLGQVLAPATAAGCAGAVDGSANFFPRALVRLHELCSRRDEVELEERARLQFRVSAMEELLVRHGLVAVKEAVYRLRGFGHPTAVRPPLARGLPGGEAEWAHWGRVLGAMEEVESALADG
ncbi:hypothetical protein CDD83_3302 [Cordyceps sp. RAO-2017]|nr:hypothetical protein CDD83_3302 [Cordyceps sp. RAO-2017]